MTSKFGKLAVLTLGLLTGPGLVSAAQAAGVNADGPPVYAQTGVIDEISPSTASIIISDKSYSMPLTLAVYRGNQKTTSLSLGKGMEVGFNVDIGPDRKRSVREIWILK